MARRLCSMASQGRDHQRDPDLQGTATARRPGDRRPATRHTMSTSFALGLAQVLRAHLALCEEVMRLAMSENQALSSQSAYQPFEFYQKRKNLLPRLEQSLMALRKWRS